MFTKTPCDFEVNNIVYLSPQYHKYRVVKFDPLSKAAVSCLRSYSKNYLHSFGVYNVNMYFIRRKV